MSANGPSISVIICAYTLERWDDLVRVVRSVLAQTRPALETIVVIDGNDELARRARETFADAVVLVNAYAAGSLRRAANRARSARAGTVVAFIDDDAVADPDWLEQLSGRL